MITSSPGSMQANRVNSSTFFDPGTSTTSVGSTGVLSVRCTKPATASLASMIPLAGV